MKNLHKIITYSLLLLILIGCSVKKDKMINRAYHAVTARYNKYFNADELYKETLSQYLINTKDDFGGILNVRKIGTEEESKALVSPFATVIEKCNDVVKSHSMKIKGKEKNPWIDETFLLLGKAYFYKQSYDDAAVIFNHGSNSFKEQDEKVTHMVWSAETQIMLGNYSVAERALNVIIEEEELKDKHKIQILQAQTEMYKRLEDYEAAAIALEKTIKYLPNGAHKTRNLFIIGQLFLEANSPDLANQYFVEVERKGKEYEFVFNALLYQAKSFDAEENDPSEILAGLDELAELPRNKEFLDQIYFAKGELYERNGDVDYALANYALAIENFTTNTKQLIRSHLAKGNIEFEETNYDLAQEHYDAVMNLIEENYPNYRLIKEKWKALSDLARLYTLVDWNDSLLVVADWTPEEQLAYATSFANREKAEKEKKEAEKLAAAKKLEEALKAKDKKEEDSDWYFGNSTLVKKGKKIFTDNWGLRPHGENWRRKDKSQLDEEEIQEIETVEEEVVDTAGLSELEKRIAGIMAEIPKDEDGKALLEKETTAAFYELGMIYKEQLDDFPKSIELFEALLKRYPNCEERPLTFYQLYRLFSLEKDKVNAEKYKSLILSEYPNTVYSDLVEKILSNTQAKKDIEESKYKAVFSDLKNENYSKVVSAVNSYLKTEGNEDFKPKYELLKAKALGGSTGREAYIEGLNKVLKTYPNTKESEFASTMLSHLESENSHFNLSVYDKKTTIAFYLVFIVDIKEIAAVESSISNFKNQAFNDDDLTISNVIYNEEYSMVSVKLFKDAKHSFDFLKAINFDPSYQKLKTSIKHELPVSTKNYSTFYSRKNLDEYNAFYDKVLKSFE